MRTYGAGVLGIVAALAGVSAASEPSGTTDTQPETRPATTPREWLQEAIDTSRELAEQSEKPDAPELATEAEMMRPADDVDWRAAMGVDRLPRASHIARYLRARPWSWAYAPWRVRARAAADPARWPTDADARRLRALLSDESPSMRAMAAEALATLHEPEDAARIARLLGDERAAAPELAYYETMNATDFLIAGYYYSRRNTDVLVVTRGWRDESVARCAQRAIALMTGRRFATERAFVAWWGVNHDGRDCLWYWQQRVERELDEVSVAFERQLLPWRQGETAAQVEARRKGAHEALLAAARDRVTAELRQRPPEVEAKVRLIVFDDRFGGSPLTGERGQLWAEPLTLRVSPDRLLDLLDREDLWPDVPWNDARRSPYSLMAEQVGMWAHALLRPADVPRLRAVLERERHNLSRSAKAALHIGISRLLPPAGEGALDDPNTRDGELRNVVRQREDIFMRDYCARELVRVGLPANEAFLIDAAFVTEHDDDNQVAQGILRALAEPPLTPDKRRMLIDLLLDPRFEPLWTRPNTRMGMDMCRQYARWAVDAYAGRRLIDDTLARGLVDPARSAESLAQVRRLVAQLKHMPTTQPATCPVSPRT